MSGLEQFTEIETGEAFTLQNRRLLKVELSATSVMAKNGAMVAYQGDVHFEHKGGGIGRLLKKAATGESLRLMQGLGRRWRSSSRTRAMLVHVASSARATRSPSTAATSSRSRPGIDWDVTRVKGKNYAGMIAGGLFNINLHRQRARRAGLRR